MYEAHALAKELKDETQKALRLERMLDIEDRIYTRASGIIEAALSFHEVTPNQEEAPPDWVEQYGPEGARQRLEVAKAGWLPQAHAPNAVKLAASLVTGISRSRAYGSRVRAAQQPLNVVISLPAPTSAEHPGPAELPERDIE